MRKLARRQERVPALQHLRGGAPGAIVSVFSDEERESGGGGGDGGGGGPSGGVQGFPKGLQQRQTAPEPKGPPTREQANRADSTTGVGVWSPQASHNPSPRPQISGFADLTHQLSAFRHTNRSLRDRRNPRDRTRTGDGPPLRDHRSYLITLPARVDATPGCIRIARPRRLAATRPRARPAARIFLACLLSLGLEPPSIALLITLSFSHSSLRRLSSPRLRRARDASRQRRRLPHGHPTSSRRSGTWVIRPGETSTVESRESRLGARLANEGNNAGDEERPRCRRCQSKQLPCSRPTKQTVFKHGSVASFSKDQKWVNSAARHFRFHPRGGAAERGSGPDSSPDATMPPLRTASLTSSSQITDAGHGAYAEIPPPQDARSSHGSPGHSSPPHSHSPMDTDYSRPTTTTYDGASRVLPSLTHSESFHTDSGPDYTPSLPPTIPSISYLTSSASHFSPRLHDRTAAVGGHAVSPPPPLYNPESPGVVPASSVPVSQPHAGSHRQFPLQDVQEACLLRYFIEEISHWFDLCDEDRHFQLVVPVLARQHPHLLDAIFAVAARHLSRLPQYKTGPRGAILYHGQALPHLDEHAAVEYMLRCIPALRQFDDARAADADYRDSIIATAVILRQLEEIDHEADDGGASGGGDGGGGGGAREHQQRQQRQRPVNFLAIIDAVLRSLPSRDAFRQRSVMQAAYWMALRQEIFNSFTRREAPQLMLPAEFWHSASRANKVVMHLVQCAKWHWGDGSDHEWMRLMKQQELLEHDILPAFQPLYQKSADKTKGEIFPTIWYGSNIEVTSVQLGLIAKSVLVAENPFLKAQSASRASWRKVENEVRLLLLELCGIALCNPASPPALVQAALGIGMYADFFTDQYERQAIRGVVERYRDTHAWPVQRLLEMFQ
ncbi:hypothetical protein PCL_04905 [Purpureocillium lilacinum]|uniref:ARCA-like protein n=1 Tax=Purpureocillium lilacinum TaxID=33203 RepID=A0A2U3DW77_PURLI|nr:hypothetical protein PCL_04905 [Purpureocillium lilacinum]